MTLAPDPSSIDQWFAAEILPHEAALMRYLTRVWPDHAEVKDLRQDVYVRVYESAARVRPATPRAFLFATARNLMVDRLRRERIVPIDFTEDLEALNVYIDEISPERRLGAREELQRLVQAFDALSDKCREVMWLRRVEGLSQRDTAARLGMHEGAVESQLARGVRALAQAVFGRVARPESEDDAKQRREARNG
ncbi:RNA polymerase sigma factor [Steroidobacter sp.]|uniref:RNA polymerase sigma factor n=1 Tax=Steroidobacter sp. TaxID=1978227 RepID=UPI001A5673F6|nr:sigma-70 family RNA polymerase sigma factor [Steroidobacter sp.]MBL8271773.1 sigma-70 family RNA polymerase sigma factor [Steroidobacter sp.]